MAQPVIVREVALADAEGRVLAADTGAGQERRLRLAGERLRAVDVAALQGVGIVRVTVREPRVRVVSTGGAATDAVALAIARAVSAHGVVVIFVRALERALAEHQTDIIITIGGTDKSNDSSVALLARVGKVHMHGFRIAPGETAALGAVGPLPVLMLPAQLDAALAAYFVVGEPLLRRLTGALASEPGVPVILAREIVSMLGLAEIVPVRRVADGVEPLASGQWSVRSLTRADGWVLVLPESAGFAAGTSIMMQAFP
jgi:molybdopterin biosynthesis enzyme